MSRRFGTPFHRKIVTNLGSKVLNEGSIFLNTSLTESFGIAILEAACAGLYVVSTRVGAVPEILPEDMISFAMPEEDGMTLLSNLIYDTYWYPISDIVQAMSVAINRVTKGLHDPIKAHERMRSFYTWQDVAERTERVYDFVSTKKEKRLWERIQT